MSKSQPVTQNTSQTNDIPAWLQGYAQQAAGQGANLPQYQAYGGPNPYANLSAQQLQALGLSSSAAGQGQGVASGGQGALQSLTRYQAPQVSASELAGQVNGLLNPAMAGDIAATNANIQHSTTQGINQEDTNLGAQGAFGGSRQAVADSIQQNQGNLTQAATDAGLNQGNYNTAMSTALSADQGNQNASLAGAGIQTNAANSLTGLGTALSGMNAQDISNLMNTGNAAQSTATNQGNFNYQQYLNSYNIPDQQAQTFASILGSLPHDTTTTGQTQSNVYTNGLLGAAGLGLGLAGLGTGGGTTLGGSALSGLGGLTLLSDRRAKEDVAVIGRLFDGTPVYRFRYIGLPTVHVGLMAQDVEIDRPEAVQETHGVKFVDYGKATARAAAMGE